MNPIKSCGFFGARYESLRFRIDEDGIAPGGVGEDKNFCFIADARYSPSRAMQFSAFAGTKFSGTLTLDDKSGNRQTDTFDCFARTRYCEEF